VLVVARNHPLASRSRIGFSEVLDYDMVGLDRASAIQRFLADKASRIGRAIRLRVQLRSFDAICRLVECNVGVGIVPEKFAAYAVAKWGVEWARTLEGLKQADATIQQAADDPKALDAIKNWTGA